MAVFEGIGAGHVEVVFGIVVKGICLSHLILLSGLCFAAIALLAEGEVEIIAVKADPISLSRLRGGFVILIGGVAVLDWCKVVHDISNYTKC